MSRNAVFGLGAFLSDREKIGRRSDVLNNSHLTKMIGGAFTLHWINKNGCPAMPCVHLKELYELCEKHDLRIGSLDAIRIVCRQCEEQDVCPSSLTDGEQVLELPRDDSNPRVVADSEGK